MGVFDSPENAVYRVTRAGTLALLDAVDQADGKGGKAKASKTQPCEAVTAYLDVSFLGPFLRSGREIPYMANAGVLGTYIDFLDHELASGALHSTPLHQTYLKLLAYVTAVEAAAPLSLFGNCLEFLAGSRERFDFGIYYDKASATKKLEAVSAAMKGAAKKKVPTAFRDLHERLKQLIDPTLRNSIAHATYHVHSEHERVDLWNRGKLVKSRSFAEVDQLYQDARSYLVGFTAGIGDFAEKIHPDCPYAWHP